MDRERFKRMRELFRAALELEVEARQAFLNAACGGDEELRADMERLIRIDLEAGTFLETPAVLHAEPDGTASRQGGRRIRRRPNKRAVS